MSGTAASPWRPLQRLAAWISDLRLAIGLLLVIAIASGIGTAIPQKEEAAFYHQLYDPTPGWGCCTGMGCCSCSWITSIPVAGSWPCSPGWACR